MHQLKSTSSATVYMHIHDLLMVSYMILDIWNQQMNQVGSYAVPPELPKP